MGFFFNTSYKIPNRGCQSPLKMSGDLFFTRSPLLQFIGDKRRVLDNSQSSPYNQTTKTSRVIRDSFVEKAQCNDGIPRRGIGKRPYQIYIPQKRTEGNFALRFVFCRAGNDRWSKTNPHRISRGFVFAFSVIRKIFTGNILYRKT